MKVTTKRYELQKKKYIAIATKALVKKEWLYGVPCAVLLILSFIFTSWLVSSLQVGFGHFF